ncbi:unnamed protein product [Kuraishia capsulata CBS 1993]|uniref:Pre-mRNA-splicing factor CWC2 n=1 Tax=Kuraishia capsulata CBS 1993 TaxID=1382522 RepID=W6MRX2_9ASCO|nr:uncharacterized protein KUCA_T00005447001 [Kuraishia capsulata CBS 1993]CDK29459.1 unnamed protein product [Kuraishia capsulata CBS 1993]
MPDEEDKDQEVSQLVPTDQPRKTKRKPARLQVDPETINADDKPPQTGTIFNLWYMKWSNGGDSSSHIQTHSKTRCHVKSDSGYTRADKHITDPNAINTQKFICLYFARGSCCMGKNCEYLHRLPGERDIFPPTLDCFGREKFSDYRDDMGGVGNFNRVNRTLYVGRINSMDQSDASGSGIDALIAKTFAEWGEVERIRVIHDKGIAFVTYRIEACAQFAREAMAHQSLIPNNEKEILNLRWASEDPDPKAKAREKRRREDVALETVEKLLNSIGDDEEAAAKRQNVALKEVEEEGEDEGNDADNGDNQKALPAAQNSTFFNGGLGILNQLKLKKLQSEPKEEPKGLQPSMLGYGSSDEE